MTEPTADQLASRAEVATFLKSVPQKLRAIGENIKSDWFGRPDHELKGWIERGQAIAEIKDSRGYFLIMCTLDNEISWATNELKRKEVAGLREYLQALEFIKGYVVTTERNAEIS